jgi:hypothetical protein
MAQNIKRTREPSPSQQARRKDSGSNSPVAVAAGEGKSLLSARSKVTAQSRLFSAKTKK